MGRQITGTVICVMKPNIGGLMAYAGVWLRATEAEVNAMKAFYVFIFVTI